MQAWKAHGHICITLGTNWVLAKQDSTRLGTQGLGSCFSELAIHAYVRGVAVSCLLAVPAAVPVQVLRPEGGVLRVNALYADGQQGCLISKVDGSLASGEGGGSTLHSYARAAAVFACAAVPVFHGSTFSRFCCCQLALSLACSLTCSALSVRLLLLSNTMCAPAAAFPLRAAHRQWRDA
jgi:hypothetical protein